MDEYVSKDAVIRLIEKAMLQAKSYDGHLDEDKALMILNSLKLYVKTLETKLIFDQYENKGEDE